LKGSAAYNLLIISAICVIAIEGTEIRRIKNYSVFLTTAGWSAFAYIWLFIVLVVITPNEVTIWEAVITFLSFPVLVVNSYMAEKNFFFKMKEKEIEEEYDLSNMCLYSLLFPYNNSSSHLTSIVFLFA
jgi:solute carrier family 8 (sodium/calcium exchanger)